MFACSRETVSNIETEFLREASHGFSCSVRGFMRAGCVQMDSSLCSESRQYRGARLLFAVDEVRVSLAAEADACVVPKSSLIRHDSAKKSAEVNLIYILIFQFRLTLFS